MKKELTGLSKISYDAYVGRPSGDYTVEDGNQAIRNAINEACGGEFTYYSFLDNKGKVFQIVANTLVIGVGELLSDKFDAFADTIDTALGDENMFYTDDNALFRVDTIADGKSDIRRQKLYNDSFSVPTARKAIKIYTELKQFMSGRYDWTKTVNRVLLSFGNAIGGMVGDAMHGAYAKLPAAIKDTGSFVEDKMDTLIEKVEVESGLTAVIWGTKRALGKITSAIVSDDMKDQINRMGHYGVYKGTVLREIPQGKKNDGTLGVDNADLYIVPEGDTKIVKIALEGDPVIYDKGAETNKAEQLEFFFGRNVGVSAVTQKVFGMYQLS
ncbi:MAG: hypothetical protein GY714_23500 [Desulfobacterales bacterium]|nr:hypothetical protein [Desulfobacterales bacterium]